MQAQESTLPQKEHLDTGNVDKREGQKYQAPPPSTEKPEVFGSLEAVKRTDWRPETHTLRWISSLPSLDSFPLHLQAPGRGPQPLLVQRGTEFLHLGLRWGWRVRDDNNPKASFASKGPSRLQGAHTPAQRTQSREMAP